MTYAAFYLLVTFASPYGQTGAAVAIPMRTIDACQLAQTVVLQDKKTAARSAICLPGL